LPAGDPARLPFAVDPERLGGWGDSESLGEVLACQGEREIGDQSTGLALEPGAEAAIEPQRGIGVIAARQAGASRAPPSPLQRDRPEAGEDLACGGPAILAGLAAGTLPQRGPFFLGWQRLIDDGILKHFEVARRVAAELAAQRPHRLTPLQALAKLTPGR
jgi:hypothetical protein